MHMVFSYCQFFKLIMILLCNVMEKLVYIFSQVTTENPFSILGCPNKVINCIIHCMSSTLDCHEALYQNMDVSGRTHHALDIESVA